MKDAPLCQRNACEVELKDEWILVHDIPTRLPVLPMSGRLHGSLCAKLQNSDMQSFIGTATEPEARTDLVRYRLLIQA